MGSKFSDMLKFGINLKLSGPSEDKYYAQRLMFFIINKEDFDADTEDDEQINIYVGSELSLVVRIVDSVLTFDPLEESCYDAIMLVLDFVANLHQQVQEDYLKDDVIENEFSTTNEMEQSDEEDESDDDMEWI